MTKSPSRKSLPVSDAWLKAFLRAIDLPRVSIPDDFLSRACEVFGASRIYVENLRSILGVSTPIAKALLGVACGRGLLKHSILFLCPNVDCGRSLIELPFQQVLLDQDLPPSVSCDVCEQLERDRHEFARAECAQLDVYMATRPENRDR